MFNEVFSRNNLKRAFAAAYGEVSRFSPQLQALYWMAAIQPKMDPERRAGLFRRFGFRLGAGTRIEGMPEISGQAGLFGNFKTGCDCEIGADCVFDLEEQIALGNRVTLGPGTMILTSTHELGPSSHRAGTVTHAPVHIGDGAWVRTRAIILPGVTIGEGAIVDVAAVVNKDVLPHTRVSGVPALPTESLEGP